MLMKYRHTVGLDTVDHLVHEAFARGIYDLHRGMAILECSADCMHQVCFPHTDAAVDEQRVVPLGGVIGNRFSRGVGKLVATANYKIFKRVFRIQRTLRSLTDPVRARDV